MRQFRKGGGRGNLQKARGGDREKVEMMMMDAEAVMAARMLAAAEVEGVTTSRGQSHSLLHPCGT